MGKQKTHGEFLEDLLLKNKHYAEGEFQVLGEYVGSKAKILTKDKYGELLSNPDSLLRGDCTSIQTAINKTAYFKNKLIDCNQHYREGKFEVLGDYINNCTKILLKDSYGLTKIAPAKLLTNASSAIGGAIDKTEYFKNKLLERNEHYQKGKFTVIGNYVNVETKIKLKDMYGYCYIDPVSLLAGCCTNILAAFDKSSYIVAQAKEVHGDLYSYHEMEYVSARTKIKIWCNTHKEFFWQKPHNHLNKQGCPICAQDERDLKMTSTFEEFVIKATLKHNDFYTYMGPYINGYTRTEIICPKHGKFWQTPGGHLSGKGCYHCGVDKNASDRTKTNTQFIKEANLKHNNFYKYPYTYVKGKDKIKIVCPIHGVFHMRGSTHLVGQGCPTCGLIKLANSNRENPTGWSRSSWRGREDSKDFHGYKVYIIECENEEEHFYKIGRTLKTVARRFNNGYSTALPYSLEVIKIFKGTADEMFDLENKLKSLNKEHKYLPKLSFGGETECFSKINQETLDYELN